MWQGRVRRGGEAAADVPHGLTRPSRRSLDDLVGEVVGGVGDLSLLPSTEAGGGLDRTAGLDLGSGAGLNFSDRATSLDLGGGGSSLDADLNAAP